MASRIRQLAPHMMVMILLYVLLVIIVALTTGRSGFWTSLAIALAVAFAYPSAIRRLGWAPEVWQR